MNESSSTNLHLIERLRGILGAEHVITDDEECRAYSADVYSSGTTCAAVISSADKSKLAKAVALATRDGFSVYPRGGGMSYTGGYIPTQEASLVVDMSQLDRIVEVNEEDMYITVEAGVTWKQIFEELTPRGLRLPFFGTFSGVRATVGGGLSNGALFMGTGHHGTLAETVLGLEVILADGTLIRTGQAAFKNVSKPFYRTYGPDYTGLFVHDTGSLGLKTQATLRLIQKPRFTDYASFTFRGIETAASALSDIGRTGAAEEAYVFDPETTAKSLASFGFTEDLRTLAGVVTGQSSLTKGIKEGLKLVVSGRSFIDDDLYSLHVICAGRSEAGVQGDLEICRRIAEKHDAREIDNSIPKAERANPFPPLNGILGPKGDRWAAVNAKVAHSDALDLIRAVDRFFEPHKKEMADKGITLSRLMIAISTHAFSFEPVFHWFDEWLPIHERTPEPSYLKTLERPKPNPDARALVDDLRAALISLLAERGAAFNQIGKTYPYRDMLDPGTARILEAVKAETDPDRLINPGALGLH